MKDEIRFFALENAAKYDGKAQVGAVIGKMLAEHPELKKDVKSLSLDVRDIIKDINAMPLEDIKKEYEELRPEEEEIEEEKGLPPLPNAEMGKVVTRMPPEPSKYNHIGHALSFLINYEYAKKYEGKCILRFEDTNPEKSEQVYVDAMLEDLQDYLGIKPDRIHYVSDDMEKFYELAEELIKLKKTYVCICDRDTMSRMRENGESCACVTKKAVAKNLEEWHNMLKGDYDEGEAILRLVGDMESDNYVMRDPVIFRINKHAHFRQGEKYHVWPLYDFENSVEDSLNGVTHILRSSEFGKMRVELQTYIKDLLKLSQQEVIQYGRFNIQGATTKGREIREKIQSGEVSGWDDPSLVTLKALKRRGIQPQTYYDLIHEVGLSKTQTTIDWSLISSINRKILDEEADRYFFVEDPVKVHIENAPGMTPQLKLHPEDPKRGKRTFTTGEYFYLAQKDVDRFQQGKLVRLMDCLNFNVDDKYTYHSQDYETYKDKGDLIIHWLPASDELIDVEVRMPDNTFRKGLAESGIRDLKEGDIIQFARFGFCRFDHKEKDKHVFWFTHK